MNVSFKGISNVGYIATNPVKNSSNGKEESFRKIIAMELDNDGERDLDYARQNLSEFMGEENLLKLEIQIKSPSPVDSENTFSDVFVFVNNKELEINDTTFNQTRAFQNFLKKVKDGNENIFAQDREQIKATIKRLGVINFDTINPKLKEDLLQNTCNSFYAKHCAADMLDNVGSALKFIFSVTTAKM